MILLDLFSGIGGFHLGLERAGFHFDRVLFSEVDRHAIANYKYNFKEAEHAGSVTTIGAGAIPRPNIITFGSPCQDFSLAGKRKGMEGQRSSLIKEAIRLIDGTRPDVFIWENVKGTFSSNAGADFWAIVKALTDLGDYRIEWQLLDTSWFLPQSRERIYLVGHLAGRSRPGVFPIGEGHGKDNVLQKQKANALTARYNTANGEGTYIVEGEQPPQVIVHNMQPRREDRPSLEYSKGGSGHLTRDNGIVYCLDTASSNAVEIIQKGYSKGNPQGKRAYDPKGISACLRHGDGDIGKSGFYETPSGLRKLTEIECERLQGFPDDWTKYGDYDGKIKKIARTNRYALCGNAVTVDVVEEVGKRLLKLIN